jgi:hypothetical protein
MSKKAIVLYAGFFGLGLVAGVISYVDYRSGTRAVEAAVAGTNAIPLHIFLAVALLIGSTLITRRLSRARAAGQTEGIIAGDGGFWRAPFTEKGWRRLVFALLGLPLGIAEFLCALFGAERAAARLEEWRLGHYLDIKLTTMSLDKKYYLISLPTGLLQALAGYLAIFTVWRAGLQVVGAFDPNFCINAWGGPTYLGASGAHWLDAFIIFYACVTVVRSLSARQGRLAVRYSK